MTTKWVSDIFIWISAKLYQPKTRKTRETTASIHVPLHLHKFFVKKMNNVYIVRKVRETIVLCRIKHHFIFTNFSFGKEKTVYFLRLESFFTDEDCSTGSSASLCVSCKYQRKWFSQRGLHKKLIIRPNLLWRIRCSIFPHTLHMA